MPQKNKNNKKGKKTSSPTKRILEFKDDMQDYAKIIKMLGYNTVTLMLPDNSEIIGVIPGRFRKRCWMNIGDVVLISYRSFENMKVDIVYKYNQDEVGKLVKMKEIPTNFFENKDIENEEVLFIDEDEDGEINFEEL